MSRRNETKKVEASREVKALEEILKRPAPRPSEEGPGEAGARTREARP